MMDTRSQKSQILKGEDGRGCGGVQGSHCLRPFRPRTHALHLEGAVSTCVGENLSCEASRWVLQSLYIPTSNACIVRQIQLANGPSCSTLLDASFSAVTADDALPCLLHVQC